jgi:AraC family transcriptional regulator, ethanolamine operon transcriptional activator
MVREGVQLSLVREPEELLGAVPGVAFRATPLRAGPFEASLTTFGLGGGVALQTGRCAPLLAVAQAAPGTAVLQLPLEGAETLVLNGRPFRPRMVGLYGGGAELLRANPRGNVFTTLSLPMDAAEALLCPPPGSPLRRPGAQGLLEAEPEAWGRAAGLVRAAATIAAAAPATFDAEPPRAALRDALLDAARGLVREPGRGRGDGRSRRDAPARRRVVLAADAHLRAHLARPIYTEELCAALGVSPATLAAAFHAAFGVSPHRFLKLRRLALVRAGLLRRGAPEEGGPAPLVKSVALAHGFWHLGQFAAEYRAMYGETPSETLARARGARG